MIFRKIIPLLLAVAAFGNLSAQQSATTNGAKNSLISASRARTFPFIVSLTSQEYDITVDLKDQKVIDKYAAVFKKNDLDFTPDEWESVVINLLRNKDSVWEQRIVTSAQDGVLRIGTGGTEYQRAFLDYMLPIFSDTDKLDAILKAEE